MDIPLVLVQLISEINLLMFINGTALLLTERMLCESSVQGLAGSPPSAALHQLRLSSHRGAAVPVQHPRMDPREFLPQRCHTLTASLTSTFLHMQ